MVSLIWHPITAQFTLTMPTASQQKEIHYSPGNFLVFVSFCFFFFFSFFFLVPVSRFCFSLSLLFSFLLSLFFFSFSFFYHYRGKIVNNKPTRRADADVREERIVLHRFCDDITFPDFSPNIRFVE